MEEATCRFCFESDGILISPCPCSGSVKYIHRTCQEKSYAVNNSVLCSICKNPYLNVTCGEIEEIPQMNTVFEMLSMYANFVISLHLIPVVFEMGGIEKTYLNIIKYQIAWQVSILLSLLGTNLIAGIKNRIRYLTILIFQSPFSYTYIQLYIWIYLIYMADNYNMPFYTLLINLSQLGMFLHFRIHAAILRKINSNNMVVFR